ncbi:MAG TPA: hypothetical protein VF054_05980 [Micromonosporaceae bacterium]
MPDSVDLSPDRYAALIAPVIDRVFVGVMRGVVPARGGRDLVRRYGGPPVGVLIEFSGPLGHPDGRVSPDGFAAVHRYRDLAEGWSTLEAAADAGLIEIDGDGSFRVTGTGRTFLAEDWAVRAAATGDLWRGHEDRVRRAVELLGRVLTAATRSGGTAFAAMAPGYEPPGATSGARLLGRLGTLRYHRADAHAAAWASTGLDAAGIQELAPGVERDAIERDTDRRAGRAFTCLDPAERLTLLADLGALPA